MRSIRLTDIAWTKSDELAQENNLTSSEMIKLFPYEGFGDTKESEE
jgi:predicted DNA-binding ribbon-helix-helix protein